MTERSARGPSAPTPPIAPRAPLANAPRAPVTNAPRVAPLAVAPAPSPAKPSPAASAPVPPVIPAIAWTSAPPPIAPRSFSTAPPPSGADLLVPPLPAPPPFDPHAAKARALVDDVYRIEEIRTEARGLVREVVHEALAPIHFALRDLERRVEQLESRPVPTASANANVSANVSTVGGGRTSANAIAVARARAADPLAPVVVAPPQALAPARPVMLSFDVAPFDGARRKRRVILLFAFFLLLVFGALFGALVWSRTRPT